MAGTIEVRTFAGEVLQVPPMRLDWATEQPRLIELYDTVAAILAGVWRPEGKPLPGAADILAVFAEFVAQVAAAAGHKGGKIAVDVDDVRAIHAALRGLRPDPTKGDAPPSG